MNSSSTSKYEQDEVFRKSEGDKWFSRNESSINNFNPKYDIPFQLLELYDIPPGKVAEVGAANGVRLAAIQKEWPGTEVVAIEPSKEAISDGKNRFPEIRFVQSIAKDIPVQGSFDIVIVNFVLHWIDRKTLFRSVSEIDRLVEDEGFLVIGDFYPHKNSKVDYHHVDSKVFTYKQNYSKIFCSSGIYEVVGNLTSSHEGAGLEVEDEGQLRTGGWLLQKQLNEYYAEVEISGS